MLPANSASFALRSCPAAVSEALYDRDLTGGLTPVIHCAESCYTPGLIPPSRTVVLWYRRGLSQDTTPAVISPAFFQPWPLV